MARGNQDMTYKVRVGTTVTRSKFLRRGAACHLAVVPNVRELLAATNVLSAGQQAACGISSKVGIDLLKRLEVF